MYVYTCLCDFFFNCAIVNVSSTPFPIQKMGLGMLLPKSGDYVHTYIKCMCQGMLSIAAAVVGPKSN